MNIFGFRPFDGLLPAVTSKSTDDRFLAKETPRDKHITRVVLCASAWFFASLASRGREAEIPVEQKTWSFASILDPVDLETFRRDYWGNQPLHVVRGRAEFYHQLITLGDIERHIAMQEFFSLHSISTPSQGYGTPELPPASLGEARQRLLDGSSLRIRRMECFLDVASPAMSLVRDMQGELQHPLESLSCYISRRGAEGLGPHHDETEIFTLQIVGRKRWRLYGRSPSDGARTYDAQRLGAPSREVVLEAGDLLYTPHGLVHDVTAEEGAFSLTIVFDPFRWRSILDVLSTKVEGTDEFLATMPAGALAYGQRTDELRHELELRLSSLRGALATIGVDDVIDAMAEKLFARMVWPPGDQMQAVLDLEAIDLETLVEIRSEIPRHLARRAGLVRLLLPGGHTIQANIRVEPAFRAVLDAIEPFRVSEMHDCLNSEAKVALAKRLVGCGLLRPVRAGRE